MKQNSKIKRIVQETINKLIKSQVNEHEQYKMQDLDELYGYMWLKPNLTNINADIFVDDGHTYLRDNHIPLLYVRNGHGREINEFIPISISDNPTILNDSIDIQLDSNTIKEIMSFIVVNNSILLSFANKDISVSDFKKSIKIPSYSIAKSKTAINEMATLRSEDSNLPNIQKV